MIKFVTLADLVTLLNAVFGFSAILLLFSNEIRLAFSLILLALLADGLDGIIARRTTKGQIGDYLEAMADMTSLSIAPLVFVYMMYAELIHSNVTFQIITGALLFFFLICSLLRLASFHILKTKQYFLGLPASVSTICLLVISYLQLDIFYVFLALLILSLALISPVRFPKPGIKINAIAAVLIIITLFLGDNYYHFAPLLLFAAVVLYAVIGPLYLWKTK